MSLATLNPWQVLDQIQKEAFSNNAARRWHPATDIVESEAEYLVVMDLPGLQANDVNIEVHAQKLHINGERPDAATKFNKTGEASEKQTATKVHYQERVQGAFNRVFHLPKDADDSAINAVFKLGVLEITIPKQAKATPRTVHIKTD